MKRVTKITMLACIVSGYVALQPFAGRTASAQQSAAPAATSKSETIPADAPFLNPALPTDQRVNDLISRMTLEEKCSQLVNQSRAIPRLKVPGYDWWSEALHGVANNGTATVFPEPVGLAATFDPD